MPCNCPPPFPPYRPPFMPRPEPFSPLPRRCPQPDPGAWIKEQLAKKYEKPEDGIPKTDLAADVQASLDKAGTAYVKPEDGIPKTDLAADVQTSLGKADTALQQHQPLDAYVTGAEYDSGERKIYLKHGDTRLANPVDATAFIKDGMVSSVAISDGKLVIAFNTDAGKEPIEIPLTDIFNPANYYNKTATDALLAGKISKSGGTMTGELNKRVATGWYVYENAEGIQHEGQDFRNIVLKWGAVPDPAGAAEQTIPFSVSWTSPFDGTTKTISGNETYYVAIDATTGVVSVIYEDGMDIPIIFEIENHNGTLHLTVFYDNGVSRDLGAFATVCPAEYTTVPYVTQADIALDNSVTKDSTNGVKSSGIWSAIWGALSALPTGFASLYDWCVSQLAGKLDKSAVVAPSTSATTGQAAGAKATGDALAGKVPTTRTVNGKELSSNVTLTGADIPVSGTDATKIDAALAGKLDKSGGTMTGEFQVRGDFSANFQVVPEIDGDSYTPPTMRFGDGVGVVGIIWCLVDGGVVMDVSDILGGTHRIALPSASGTLALDTDLLTKLDASSASDAFSPDPSVSYPVGSHCTYNGKLYKCTTATTGGTWDASKWTADTMTDPDAVLDITAQNQLRVVAKDGTLLWAQGYDLASTSSATLACGAVNNFTFADGATTQAFTLPTAPTGKVGDFGLDIDNSANTGAATMTLTGLDTTFSVVVPEGESLNDMLAIAAGELARFYISLSTFRVNNLPTWHIVKQIVENGGAQS